MVVAATATATASKVDAVAQCRCSDAALTTTTATFLALKIVESNITAAIAGKTNKRPFDNFLFDVFAESDCKDDKTNEVVIEDDPADGVSEAGVADAGSDGSQTGHFTDITDCIAGIQEHNPYEHWR
jgi:hypothetical protein